jgi:putative flippase GtrA
LISSSFIKYGVIGVVNTLFSYTIIFLLVYINFSAELSNFIGYFLGIFLSYYLNKKYNFKSKNSYKKEMPKFLTSMFIAYLLNLIALVLCYRYIGINVYISQLIAGVVYTLAGYVISKVWVFNEVNS